MPEDYHLNMPFMKDAHVVPEPAFSPAPARVFGQKEHVRLFPGQPCFYCEGTTESVDHKIPRSRAGTNDISNKVPSCHRCNQMKADLTIEEFVARMKLILKTLSDKEDKKVIQFGEELKWPVAVGKAS